MPRLGVDFGGSILDVALEQQGEISQSWSFANGTYACTPQGLAQLLQDLALDRKAISAVVTTGGRSRNLPEVMGNVPLVRVGEMEAIGRGGQVLTGLAEPLLVVSLGTGTAMVEYQEGESKHVGGTGVGGGTLLGLARLMGLGTKFDAIEALAGQGDAGRVDLSIADIVGSGIGRLPGNFVASHFAKAAKCDDYTKADQAAGIFHLVTASIAMLAVALAQAEKLQKIVFIGRLAESHLVQQFALEIGKAYQVDMVFPDEARLGAVRGALREGGERGVGLLFGGIL
jgi:type II pantothenate kinase